MQAKYCMHIFLCCDKEPNRMLEFSFSAGGDAENAHNKGMRAMQFIEYYTIL